MLLLAILLLSVAKLSPRSVSAFHLKNSIDRAGDGQTQTAAQRLSGPYESVADFSDNMLVKPVLDALHQEIASSAEGRAILEAMHARQQQQQQQLPSAVSQPSASSSTMLGPPGLEVPAVSVQPQSRIVWVKVPVVKKVPVRSPQQQQAAAAGDKPCGPGCFQCVKGCGSARRQCAKACEARGTPPQICTHPCDTAFLACSKGCEFLN